MNADEELVGDTVMLLGDGFSVIAEGVPDTTLDVGSSSVTEVKIT